MEKLRIGETRAAILVDATQRWNPTGLLVGPGESYRVQASADRWYDAGIPADADGQPGNFIQKLFEWLIRCKQATWFQLVAALGQSDKWLFPLGRDACLTIPDGAESELTLFANDVSFMYGNNSGSISIRITRLA